MIAEVWNDLRRDFLRQAFTRYDVDRSGRLDGKDRFRRKNASGHKTVPGHYERVRWRWWSVFF